jgi:hypothetical protein
MQNPLSPLRYLSKTNQRRFLLYCRWLQISERINDLMDSYADLPYVLRRAAFNWSARAFYPAHWVR